LIYKTDQAVPKAVLSCKKELFDLAYALRAKPVTPVPHRFIAYIHPSFTKQVFYVPQ